MEALRRKDPLLPAGWPAIVAAAYEDETDSVQWLLEARSNPNDLTPNKSSALWHAVSNNNFRNTCLLLEAGADANHRRKNARGAWRSVLDMAENDCVSDSILRALLAAGAERSGGKPPRWPRGSRQLAIQDRPFLLGLLDSPQGTSASSRLRCKEESAQHALPVLLAQPVAPDEAAAGRSLPPGPAEAAGGGGVAEGGARPAPAAEEAVSREEMFRALADVLSEAEASDSDVEGPPRLEGNTSADGSDVNAVASQALSSTAPSTQPLAALAAGPECLVDRGLAEKREMLTGGFVRRPSAADDSPPAMTRGSAFAARSAFRKAYSRQLLPLCDEKPVLDFSVYHRSESSSARAEPPRLAEAQARQWPPRSYAGMVLPKKRVRGEDKEAERTRARIVAGVDFAAFAAARAASSGSPPPTKARPAGRGAERSGAPRPDLLADPWGCVLAAEEPPEDAPPLAEPTAPRVAEGPAATDPCGPPPASAGGGTGWEAGPGLPAVGALCKRMPVPKRESRPPEGPLPGGPPLGCEAAPGAGAPAAAVVPPVLRPPPGPPPSSSLPLGTKAFPPAPPPGMFVASGDAAAGAGVPPMVAPAPKVELEAEPSPRKAVETPWWDQWGAPQGPPERPPWRRGQEPGQQQQQQQQQQQTQDLPGVYCICKNTFASNGIALGCEKAGFLEIGATVKVLEIVRCEAFKRVRGRIEEPSGWISLLDTETGTRYAERKADVDGGGPAGGQAPSTPPLQQPFYRPPQASAVAAQGPLGCPPAEASWQPPVQRPPEGAAAQRAVLQNLPPAFWKAKAPAPAAAAAPCRSPAISADLLAALPPGALDAVPLEPEPLPGDAPALPWSAEGGASSSSGGPLASLDAAGGLEQQPLPKMSEEPHGALDESKLNEAQISIVKELAGGARFHDPARDRWACRDQAKNSCLIDVRKLRFCHATISPHFMHGNHRGLPVLTLLKDLHAAKADPRQLPPMVVMRTGKGLEVVCGNRRLYCLKRYAAEASASVSAWCIVYDLKAQDTPRALVMKYILAATTQDGGSIQLRNL